MTPTREIVRVLERAYPCAGFEESCRELVWDPGAGHLPRGYGGATGTADDVRVVLVTSPPGEPDTDEALDPDAGPLPTIDAICRRTYLDLTRGRDQYHRNLRYILDLIFPGAGLEEQLRRTWLTRSVLCSAATAGEDIPAAASLACRLNYLDRELEVFANARVVALGMAARRRLKGYPGLLEGGDPAPPFCNQRSVREGWIAMAARL